MADTSSPKPSQSRLARKENNKSAQYKAPESSDHDAIRTQVEFYFGNSNLPYDAFLLKQANGVENQPIPIKTIHAFKRMQHFQPYSAVVEALQGSEELTVSGDSGEEKVARRSPIGNRYTLDANANRKLDDEERDARTVYAKGFGVEETDTQIKIEELFAPFSPTAVRLRRTPRAQFKGSGYIEFPTPEAAREFMYGPGGDEEAFKNNEETAPRSSVKFKDQDLQFLFKAVHDKEKAEQLAHFNKQAPVANGRQRGNRHGQRNQRRGNDMRRNRNRSRSPRRNGDAKDEKAASHRSRSPAPVVEESASAKDQNKPDTSATNGQADSKPASDQTE